MCKAVCETKLDQGAAMAKLNFVKIVFALVLLALVLSTMTPAAAVRAQSGEELKELKQRAADLIKQTKYTEALPLLEKIVVAEPDSAEMNYYLGSALLGEAANARNDAARKALRIRARNAFIKSKALGIKQPNIDAMIQGLPADGADASAFSQNNEANAFMVAAEALFSQGKLDEALKNYQQALALDPGLYHAALFSGDVFTQKGDFAQAEIWYKKAIEIDPTRETAYRYSATPLMKSGKIEAARDRYIEAYITEPYNKFTTAGLIQWAQATHTSLAHPKIDIPTNITFDEKGDAKINLDAGSLMGSVDDGSFAWISYGATRSTWRKEKFARQHPGDAYRHSLAEEAEALRSVVSIAAADKRTKSLSPSLAKLKKLNDEGLLEAYILMARPDEGISQDHPAYLRDHRELLRRYVLTYVLTGGVGGSPSQSAA
jgi:tetratricopeptide (TPR) repeat protein